MDLFFQHFLNPFYGVGESIDIRHIVVDKVLAIMEMLAFGRNRATNTQTNP